MQTTEWTSQYEANIMSWITYVMTHTYGSTFTHIIVFIAIDACWRKLFGRSIDDELVFVFVGWFVWFACFSPSKLSHERTELEGFLSKEIIALISFQQWMVIYYTPTKNWNLLATCSQIICGTPCTQTTYWNYASHADSVVRSINVLLLFVLMPRFVRVLLSTSATTQTIRRESTLSWK